MLREVLRSGWKEPEKRLLRVDIVVNGEIDGGLRCGKQESFRYCCSSNDSERFNAFACLRNGNE